MIKWCSTRTAICLDGPGSVVEVGAAEEFEQHARCCLTEADCARSLDIPDLLPLLLCRDVKRLDRRDAHKYRNSKAKTKSAKVGHLSSAAVLLSGCAACARASAHE